MRDQRLMRREEPGWNAAFPLFQRAAEAAGYGILITDAAVEHPGPIIRFANRAMQDMTGYAAGELVGATPRMLQGPATDRAMLDRLKAALRRGDPFSDEAINYRKDGSSYVVDWMIDPVRDDAGAIRAWIAIQHDATRRSANRIALEDSERRLHTLVAELQHRTRNLMGVVRSMADKTARASGDLPDFCTRFHARLDALARVQALLSRLGETDRVTFDDLIRTELAAMDGDADSVTLEGPAGVRLRSSTVQTLALALHELATNAIKYGALRRPGGRLTVTWQLATHGREAVLHIDWRERGVRIDAARAGQRSGQGRELIEQALPYQLRAETRFRFAGDGVHCTIAVPVSHSNLTG